MILHIPCASHDIPWYEGYILSLDRLRQEMYLPKSFLLQTRESVSEIA
jgi:hypothetical protein